MNIKEEVIKMRLRYHTGMIVFYKTANRKGLIEDDVAHKGMQKHFDKGYAVFKK